MTVPTLQLATAYAHSILAQKLAENGFKVHTPKSDAHVLLVEWDAEAKSVLVELLTNFILLDWCYEYIHRRVGVLHDYLTDDEREYIALLTFHALRKADGDVAGKTVREWHDFLAESVSELMSQNTEIVSSVHVDGMVRFRMKDYLSLIDTGIQEVLDQFLADREYEEFVSMLRYMLDSQQPSNQVLHVFCSDDQVWLTDAAGDLIRDPMVTQAAEQASDGGDVNPEDLAMSILITRAPCRIVIHDITVAAPWPSFAETVEKVFLDRAVRCRECSTCRRLAEAHDLAGDGSLHHKYASPDEFK
jgi:putative sporulation protein YtxC